MIILRLEHYYTYITTEQDKRLIKPVEKITKGIKTKIKTQEEQRGTIIDIKI